MASSSGGRAHFLVTSSSAGSRSALLTTSPGGRSALVAVLLLLLVPFSLMSSLAVSSNKIFFFFCQFRIMWDLNSYHFVEFLSLFPHLLQLKVIFRCLPPPYNLSVSMFSYSSWLLCLLGVLLNVGSRRSQRSSFSPFTQVPTLSLYITLDRSVLSADVISLRCSL